MINKINTLSQNTRLIVACAISAVIILLWDQFILGPIQAEQEAEKVAGSTQEVKAPQIKAEEYTFTDRETVIGKTLKSHERIHFENNLVKGSISLQGARIDDLLLKKYNTTADKSSENEVLFSPGHTRQAYFAEFGWVKAGEENLTVPDNKTMWQADKDGLKAGETLNLSWVNPQGVKFVITISLDENYMFDIKQRIENKSGVAVSVSPYALISRLHDEVEASNLVVHQGAIGVLGGKLKEVSYSDLVEENKQEYKDKTEWFGFSDKYWLAAIIPGAAKIDHVKFTHAPFHNHNHYQTSMIGSPETIQANDSSQVEFRLFAGAKELNLLDDYEKKFNIKLFDRAVDFGILYFITRPILILLHYFYTYLGNFGAAILLLTVFIKLLLFPLAHKGYKGMNRLKDLQPKMAALKEKFADNPSGFQQALIELYRKEKVNPMSGCLPIILQIPVFFALYKVLYVSIEMRHAPFFGWIKDLSAPDPTSIFNLFGLIPIDLPNFLMVGFFPLLMAVTMYLQQKLNPEPTDPTQALVMKLMPWVLLFMFASFPSGLVIYWAWSNILSIMQQLFIRKLEGGSRKVRTKSS